MQLVLSAGVADQNVKDCTRAFVGTVTGASTTLSQTISNSKSPCMRVPHHQVNALIYTVVLIARTFFPRANR